MTLAPVDGGTVTAVVVAGIVSLGGLVVLVGLSALRLRALEPEVRRVRIYLASGRVLRAFGLFSASALCLVSGYLPLGAGLDLPSWYGAVAAAAWYGLVVAALYQVYRIISPPRRRVPERLALRRPTPAAAADSTSAEPPFDKS